MKSMFKIRSNKLPSFLIRAHVLVDRAQVTSHFPSIDKWNFKTSY